MNPEMSVIIYICNHGFAYEAMNEARELEQEVEQFYMDVVLFLLRSRSSLVLHCIQKKIS